MDDTNQIITDEDIRDSMFWYNRRRYCTNILYDAFYYSYNVILNDHPLFISHLETSYAIRMQAKDYFSRKTNE